MELIGHQVKMNGIIGNIVGFDISDMKYIVEFDDEYFGMPIKWHFSYEEVKKALILKPRHRCTCGAAVVYSKKELTPYHHGPSCKLFKGAE